MIESKESQFFGLRSGRRSIVVTFQQLQARFARITIEPHPFCSLQNYLTTKARQLNVLRPCDRAL